MKSSSGHLGSLGACLDPGLTGPVGEFPREGPSAPWAAGQRRPLTEGVRTLPALDSTCPDCRPQQSGPLAHPAPPSPTAPPQGGAEWKRLQ